MVSKLLEDFAVWQVPGKSRPVIYSQTLMYELARQSSRAYQSFPNGGSEIGGVLFGIVDQEEIRITAAREVPCEYRHGPCFVLSPSDEETLQHVIGESASDPDLRGLVPVGWYHSHTRSPISLSPEDVRIWNRFFAQPWQVALVLRPQQNEPTRAGFFFRPESGPVRIDSSYKVFQADSGLTSAETVQNLVDAVLNTPNAEGGTAPEPVDVAVPEPPEELFHRPRRRSAWKWLGAVGIAALSVAVGAIYLKRTQSPQPAKPALGLRLVDRGGQLRAVWDATSPIVVNAERGAIEIQDGAEKTRLPMNSDLLRGGSVPILRPRGDVEVTLEVEVPSLGNREVPTREVARYLADSDISGEHPSRNVGALREELARLQSELATHSAANSQIESRIVTLRRGASPADQKAEAAELNDTIAALRRKEQERLLAQEREIRMMERQNRDSRTQQERRAQIRSMVGPSVAINDPSETPAPVPSSITSAASDTAPAPPTPAAAAEPPASSPPEPVYSGPSRGRIIWTGYLAAGATVTINGRSASTGSVNGSLPGVPVRISAQPGQFSQGGLSVFSGNQQYAEKEVVEPRSAQNGWMATRYQYDPARAAGIQVAASPSAASGNRQLQLRASGQAVSVVLIDWEVVR
jgi:proteasome lid subunit RPN8/RPN11